MKKTAATLGYIGGALGFVMIAPLLYFLFNFNPMGYARSASKEQFLQLITLLFIALPVASIIGAANVFKKPRLAAVLMTIGAIGLGVIFGSLAFNLQGWSFVILTPTVLLSMAAIFANMGSISKPNSGA